MTAQPKMPREPFTPQDLPMFWQGRAKALRILDGQRRVSDAITLETARVYEECAAELLAGLNASTTPTETTDWVLVPREPTIDMVERGREALSNGDAKVQTHARVMWVWEAMISAAPTASTTQSGDERTAFERTASGVADAIDPMKIGHPRDGYLPHWQDGMDAAALLRAKHTSGPGGVSLTDADKFLIADMRAIIEDGDSHGRAATHPTTIHLRQGLEQLILLITRLQGSPS